MTHFADLLPAASDTAASATLPRAATRVRSRYRWAWGSVITAALAAGGLAVTFVHPPGDPPEPSIQKSTPTPPLVVGLGYIEPSTTVIRLAAPGNQTQSRLDMLLVDEGDLVSIGQVLAVLDTAKQLMAQVTASQAEVALKQIMLDKQRLDVINTVQVRAAGTRRAQAALLTTQAEHARQQSLVARDVSSRSAYDKALRDYLQTSADAQEASAALTRILAITQVDQPGDAAIQIDIAASKHELAAAEANLSVSQARLEEALIRAPFSGRVLAIHMHAGERIGNDGVLDMGATASMRAVIEVYETDISRVRLFQEVELRADALDTPVRGIVQRIGQAVKRQTVVNNDPASATDARVIEVRVGLDAESSRKVAALSRLQVRAVFQP